MEPMNDGPDDSDSVSRVSSSSELHVALSKEEKEQPLIKLPVLQLRPTQLAAGFQQVGEKEEKVASKKAKSLKKLDKFLRNHPIPVVLGPFPPASIAPSSHNAASALESSATTQQPGTAPAVYLIDHHHLSRALYLQGVDTCYCQLVADWRAMEWKAFWQAMKEKGYTWPRDAQGQELDFDVFVSSLPADVSGLHDDPYRSLAALVRKAGGYEKVWVPFSEFRWANWLRERVPIPDGCQPNQPDILQAACLHAHSPAAAHLPGFVLTQQPPEEE